MSRAGSRTHPWARHLSLVALLIGSATQAAAIDPPLPLGVVIDRVECAADPGQTYALFLPSTYRPDRRWPILYAFDPQARGRMPTQLFSSAAERLGMIVVGSNNSRNGPFPPVRAALEAVWQDTHARLAIDPERVYTTGMSGGTLPALLLGTSQGAGVISCAGAVDSSYFLPGELRFTWIGIAGDADFNYEWTRTLVDYLVTRGVVARFTTFAGGHGWPPEELAGRALDWLDLASMRTGRKPPDAAFVEAAYEQGLARARELAEHSRVDDAAEENAALARELAGLRPVDALAAEARRLAASPEAVKSRQQRRALAEHERAESGELSALRRKLEEGTAQRPVAGAGLSALSRALEDLEAARDDLHRRLDRLAREMASATDPASRVLAQRLLDGFWVETLYAGWDQRGAKRFDAAQVDFDLCARVRPTNAAPVYELARIHAASGDRKKAFADLRRAMALGFADLARLSGDPEWAALKDRPEYRAAVEDLRSQRASDSAQKGH
jgi:hypothetical protein